MCGTLGKQVDEDVRMETGENGVLPVDFCVKSKK